MSNKINEPTGNLPEYVTRRAYRNRCVVGLAAMALMRCRQNQASAIINGQIDEVHPNVGGFVWLVSPRPPTPAPLAAGTGALIHPRVVLTAGHGTNVVEGMMA